jgi:hypothetical protein
MLSTKAIALVIFVWLAVGSTAYADVQLSIRDGRISIVAKETTVSEILIEWARIGQTKIVNGEKIPRDRITIELNNVSEQEALDVVLRRVSGYVAAPRTIAIPKASLFDRILVMPPSVAPLPTSAAPVAANVSVPPAAQASVAQASPVQASTEQATAEQTAASPRVASQTAAGQTAASQTVANPPSANSTAADQTATYETMADQPADPSAYRMSVDPAYRSSAEYQKAMTYQAMPDTAPYSQQGAFVQPEGTASRRRPLLARSQPSQGSQGSAPKLQIPIFQPQAVAENVNVDAANDANVEPPPPTMAGATPPPSPSAQATFASRQGLETVDPRQFQVPPQLLQGGAVVAPPARVVRPGGGVAVPGLIVPPPAPPRQPPTVRE